MTWTALLILALMISSTAVAVGVALNIHIAKPVDSIASPVSAKQPVLKDPIDTDGPGATFTGRFR